MPIGEKTKELWKDHKWRKKVSDSIRRNAQKNPNFGWRGKKLTQKHKKKLSESKKGENNPFYGKKHTKKTREKISKNSAKVWLGKKIPKYIRKKISVSNKGKIPWIKGKKHTEEAIEKNRKANLGKHYSPKTEFKKGHKWEDPKIKKKMIENTMKALLKRPTSFEKKISELCVEYNLPFIYTGDGTFLIGYKNPDFVHKTQKIVIEVYHNYFKIRDFGSCEEYEKQRGEHFAKYGYKTIFIRTEDVINKDWETICLNKLK